MNKNKNSDENTTRQLNYLLKSKLLSFGGKDVVLQKHFEDSYTILSHGKLWDGDAYILKNPRWNPCELWLELHEEGANGFYLVMGYALWADGIWRERLWLSWHVGEMEIIGETKKGHDLYYGYVLAEQEAEQICRYFGFARSTKK